ncbi:heme A synthase [Polymorphobacter multimanifer]|uniref:Heme A synthase n=1 Tax=Polymorphobacter multimanifer TaxID=1070431 RepID=A0A841L4H0_9SPHN|nr:COX15/CtaA family protein [Polymorphobacter multimanifer]MBB6227749.1 cytochrome c oxidase assembly protein subunit 15 [Polymorphobacter multimanifer]GGI76726.1 heme A synthase [Polymorphobacter multimanifer]
MATLASRLNTSIAPASRAAPAAVAGWLLGVAGLVFAMVVVGGITRLTESGLSIVRWDVVSGTLPPLTDAAWAAEFAAYRQSSQYQLMNSGMSLAAFKGIFFWEYVHRLLGRVIGLAFALPLAWFWLRGRIPAGYKPRLLALLALGALQGTIGWWMVSSGLVGRTEVAHTRLAVHLGTALTIMAGLIWTALDLTRTARSTTPRPHRWVIPFAAVLAVQIVWGAFTAGLRAGHASDTWPQMAGALVPPGLAGGWAGLTADPFTVHFIHRSLALAVAAAALLVAVRLWQAGARPQAAALAVTISAQFALGVATVLSGVALPLGVAHQACGALLVAATVWAAHWSVQKPVSSRS